MVFSMKVLSALKEAGWIWTPEISRVLDCKESRVVDLDFVPSLPHFSCHISMASALF